MKPDEEYKKVIKIYLAIAVLMISVIPLIPILIICLMNGWYLVIYIYLIFMAIAPILGYFVLAPSIGEKIFESYSYELEDEGIRINSGIITKRQKFIPYEKIQNLELKRGILERRYGLATIAIETAGSAVSYAPEGMLVGLREPEPIMEEIRARMKKTSISNSP